MSFVRGRERKEETGRGSEGPFGAANDKGLVGLVSAAEIAGVDVGTEVGHPVEVPLGDAVDACAVRCDCRQQSKLESERIPK